MLPSAIIFINPEMSAPQLDHIKKQLFINEVLQDTEFNERLVADPNYAQVVHGQNLRILVLKTDFADLTNREYADLVVFVKQGLMSVLKNKFGPPATTFSVNKPNLWDLLRSADSKQVVILPSMNMKTLICQNKNHSLGGIFSIMLADSGLSACKN